MKYYTVIGQRWRTIVRAALGITSVFLSSALIHNASAMTVQEVMENVQEVYQDVENYAAVAYTYKADSMTVSGSLFETQQPLVSFKLFFRKPDEHVVKEIGNSPHGIFRIELLSAIGKFEKLDVNLHAKEHLLGEECHVLEITDPDKPGDRMKLWVSPENWTVLQLTIFIKRTELVRTQFKHAPISRKYLLPVETRSFFPGSKQVFINRITDYEINTAIPDTLFEKRLSEPNTNQ